MVILVINKISCMKRINQLLKGKPNEVHAGQGERIR